MARYHEGMRYHEDEIIKHKISLDELKFFDDLQKELNTQDHVSQADPRFWVIKGTERLYNVEDADGYELYNRNCCDTVASNMNEIVAYINENLIEDINNSTGMEYKVNLSDGIFGENILIEWIDDGESESEELKTNKDIINWLDEHGYDEYEIISYKIIPKIYEDTMFLTQIDAENHLRKNYYHYSEDAHTYAMTAWRSPRVEMLIKILQGVDWKALYSE